MAKYMEFLKFYGQKMDCQAVATEGRITCLGLTIVA